MDQINIVTESAQNRTKVGVHMTCEDDANVGFGDVFVIDNEFMAHLYEKTTVLDVLASSLTRCLRGEAHVDLCLSCRKRIAPLVALAKHAMKNSDAVGWHNYIVMDVPVARFAPDGTSNDFSINTKTYEVHIRRFDVIDPDGPSDSLSELANALPGIDIKVKMPCNSLFCPRAEYDNEHHGGRSVRNVVIHLNDSHKWTRERIADWLDSIDDPDNGVDLAFKVPEKEKV